MKMYIKTPTFADYTDRSRVSSEIVADDLFKNLKSICKHIKSSFRVLEPPFRVTECASAVLECTSRDTERRFLLALVNNFMLFQDKFSLFL